MKVIAIFAVASIVITVTNAFVTTKEPRVNRDVEGDPDLEAYLREAIENFREQMKDGIEAIKMPVLDPLVLKHLDINVREDAATLDLKIHEVKLEGLANFTVPSLHANLEELYVSITLGIPLLIAHGQYNLSSMIYKIFPIYGYGPFVLTASEINMTGTGQLQFVEHDLLQMTSLALDLEWRNITMELGNFLGGGKLQAVLERAIPGVGRDLFIGFKPVILQYLNSAVVRKVNEELSDPKIRKIISGILRPQDDDYEY